MGFRIADIPGAGLKEKATQLGALDPVAFHALVAKAGFEVVVSEGQVIVIPAGFIMMIVSSSGGCSGLKWGLSLNLNDVEDTPVVENTANMMVQAYPELDKGPLGQFIKALSNM